MSGSRLIQRDFKSLTLSSAIPRSIPIKSARACGRGSPTSCISRAPRSTVHDVADRVPAWGLDQAAEDLLRLGIIDAIVPEPVGGAHRRPESAIDALGAAIEAALAPLTALDGARLREERRQKYLAMGRHGL